MDKVDSFCGGMIVGMCVIIVMWIGFSTLNRNDDRRHAIKRGIAQYNTINGNFQWIKVDSSGNILVIK